ncbi:MAG: hypothetical protein LBB89_02980 [Treponema sp.]|jgi:hypothetical protein|nr:hypothetical protein [Treponema sp.]
MKNNSIKSIFKKNPILIALIFYFFASEHFCFANENIRRYMEQNNMNYPYNLAAAIKNSFFMDKTLENDEDIYVKQFKLTPDQINLLIPFFLDLEVINKSDNFRELKEQKNVIAFSILRVSICRETDEYEGIYVSICFYSDKKLGNMSIYDNNYNFWFVHNIAVYSMIDYEFKGWVF